VLQAAIAAEERRSTQRALTVALEFSRTSNFANLDTLQPRIASIGINQLPSTSTHQLMVKGDGQAECFSITSSAVEQPLEDFRGALRNATYDDHQDPRFPADTELTPERRALFEQTIRDLAQIGGGLHDGLFKRAKPSLKRVLRSIADSSDKTIQVVRFDVNNVLPWAAIYDYGRPTPIAGEPPKPVCLGWGPGVGPQGPPGKHCDHSQRTDTYCVYGFWGIRHVIEELIPLGEETEESDAKLQVTRSDSENAVWLSIDNDDAFTEKLENQLHDTLGPRVLRRVQPVDDLLALLWQADQRPVVLIVLGHVEAKTTIIEGEPIDLRIVLVPNKKWLIVRDLLRHAKLEERWDQPQTVILLMGCGTADVTAKTLNDFVTSLSSIGAGAVLGTECPAFPSLVARFAGSITTELWSSQTVTLGTAVKEFRRSLTIEENPLGFVFNLLGSADLTLGRWRQHDADVGKGDRCAGGDVAGARLAAVGCRSRRRRRSRSGTAAPRHDLPDLGGRRQHRHPDSHHTT
jgi:hypothetical protein